MSESVYWTHWSWWSLCENPCDSGTRIRTRQCVPSATAKYGGTNNCTGLAEETQSCSQGVNPGIYDLNI